VSIVNITISHISHTKVTEAMIALARVAIIAIFKREISVTRSALIATIDNTVSIINTVTVEAVADVDVATVVGGVEVEIVVTKIHGALVGVVVNAFGVVDGGTVQTSTLVLHTSHVSEGEVGRVVVIVGHVISKVLFVVEAVTAVAHVHVVNVTAVTRSHFSTSNARTIVGNTSASCDVKFILGALQMEKLITVVAILSALLITSSAGDFSTVVASALVGDAGVVGDVQMIKHVAVFADISTVGDAKFGRGAGVDTVSTVADFGHASIVGVQLHPSIVTVIALLGTVGGTVDSGSTKFNSQIVVTSTDVPIAKQVI
jgi:hypothetical protein